jgi:hypothetical protein
MVSFSLPEDKDYVCIIGDEFDMGRQEVWLIVAEDS